MNDPHAIRSKLVVCGESPSEPATREPGLHMSLLSFVHTYRIYRNKSLSTDTANSNRIDCRYDWREEQVLRLIGMLEVVIVHVVTPELKPEITDFWL
jgi:hypothetical protein